VKKGDLVLIPFPFTDLSGNKLRPAVILADYGQDVVVAFITSQTHKKDKMDMLLEPSIQNGLKKTSIIKVGKIATLEKTLLVGKLGTLNSEEVAALDDNLHQLFSI
jgi:mRNA interferase MazF